MILNLSLDETQSFLQHSFKLSVFSTGTISASFNGETSFCNDLVFSLFGFDVC